jgi:hypothetical protein
VGDQVQQLRDFGLKGMGLFAHINSRVKKQKIRGLKRSAIEGVCWRFKGDSRRL